MAPLRAVWRLEKLPSIESPRCPKALRTRLATDLASTAGKSCRCGQTAAIQSFWLAAGPRRIASKLAPHSLRAESPSTPL